MNPPQAVRLRTTLPHLRDELLRQRRILDREATVRLAATALAYGLCTLFLPTAVVAVLAVINLLGELVSWALLRDLERTLIHRWRYRAVIAVTFVFELCFVLPAGMMWHVDAPFAQALAVGITASAMMHIATVRAIHLPIGLGGAAAIWLVVLTSNGLYWGWRQDWLPLAVTSVTALVALVYFVSALLSNHRVHRETAAGWAEAMAANAAKTRFLAQMSHELRTSLNAILGMGHAELAQQTDPASQSRLQVLVGAATGLGVLLDDILDTAAVQEGRLPIRPVPMDPRATLASTVALFRPQAEALGLTLDLTLADDLPRAGLADDRRLRQCLSNVLSNALKFTTRGGIRVTATCPVAGRLRIEVHDSGPGVPLDLREAVFEPFHRGTGSQPGTGLGLTISRTLAQRMGGDLEILPTEQGARFCLTVALGAADPRDLAPRAISQPLALKDQPVLVVDDIATNRLVAATFLRHLGATVSEADSGAAALAKVTKDPPAAILLDMNMPGMDGLETLQRLRSMGGTAARIPVIAMTADATEAHRRAYLEAGMDGYIAKPLTPDGLAEVLQPYFSAAPASVPSPASAPAPGQGTIEIG